MVGPFKCTLYAMHYFLEIAKVPLFAISLIAATYLTFGTAVWSILFLSSPLDSMKIAWNAMTFTGSSTAPEVRLVVSLIKLFSILISHCLQAGILALAILPIYSVVGAGIMVIFTASSVVSSFRVV